MLFFNCYEIIILLQVIMSKYIFYTIKQNVHVLICLFIDLAKDSRTASLSHVEFASVVAFIFLRFATIFLFLCFVLTEL